MDAAKINDFLLTHSFTLRVSSGASRTDRPFSFLKSSGRFKGSTLALRAPPSDLCYVFRRSVSIRQAGAFLPLGTRVPSAPCGAFSRDSGVGSPVDRHLPLLGHEVAAIPAIAPRFVRASALGSGVKPLGATVCTRKERWREWPSLRRWQRMGCSVVPCRTSPSKG